MACPSCSLILAPSKQNYGPNHLSIAQPNQSIVRNTKVIVNDDRNVQSYEAWEGEKGWAKIYIQPHKPCKHCGKEPESDLITGNVKFERSL